MKLCSNVAMVMGGFVALATMTGCAASVGQTELSASVSPGATYHGFKLVEERRIAEIDSVARLFEHAQTGARLLKLENEDDNKTFCITFKTPPDNDTGVPHILEHAVLQGSQKFPVRGPFKILTQGSMSTFLNAMTAQDHTMYPVASRNRKDFFNLMDVYLDAVFFPRAVVDARLFLQEGWRYEVDEQTGGLRYNGIVYNEMKGAFSSPGAELYRTIGKGLFPDTAYGYSSGGHPEAIPELTHAELAAFHQRYYHPSNSYILLYGDGDTLEELAFIDKNYLSRFQHVEPKAEIAEQIPFGTMREAEAHYSIGAHEEVKDRAYLAMSFVVGGAEQPELSFAMRVLTDVLVNASSAPIRKAMLAAGLGKDVSASFNPGKQSVFSIVLENANAQDKERFKTVVLESLAKLAGDGLERKLVDGVVNRREFALREADYGSFPKGLVYNFFALPGWLHASEPFAGLEYETRLNRLRQGIAERYFEQLIERHLLGSRHSLLSVVSPSKGLEEEVDARIRERLAAIRSSLSAEQVEEIKTQVAELRAYQQTPDSPEEVAKVPLLALSDIEREVEALEVVERRVYGSRVIMSPQSTNGIVYFSVLFDVSVLPKDLVPYAALLADVLGELNTENFSYADLNNEINIHTGGIRYALEAFKDRESPGHFLPKFVARGSVMPEKLGELMGFLGETLLSTRFDEPDRLVEVLGQVHAGLQARARSNGMGMALTRLRANYSAHGRYSELTRGLSYVKFVADIVKNYESRAAEVSGALEQVAETLFARNNLLVAIVCSKADCEKPDEHLPTLLVALGKKAPAPTAYAFDIVPRNAGLTAASKVQYVTRGANYRDLGYEYTGRMKVLEQILSRDFLHERIRVRGGAYGSWAMFDEDGFVAFGSYRDPNLTETLAEYEQAVEYLRGFDADDRRMTRFVIGTIARVDRPKSPFGKGWQAITDRLENWRHEDRQRERDEIISTRSEDIRQLTNVVSDVMKEGRICVYGNESKLQDNSEIFDELVDVGEKEAPAPAGDGGSLVP